MSKDHINDIEQHSRRWCVRVNGIPAPKGGWEKTEITKSLVQDTIASKMNIDIPLSEMDTAHRTGKKVNGKQTVLIRFFRREWA